VPLSYAGRTQLVHIPGNLIAARYRDEVLKPHMLPAMNLRREVFLHDNARSHTAGATVDFLANQNVSVPLAVYITICGKIRINAYAVVNQRWKLCKNCSRLLSKNGGEFRKAVFVD
jgi:hypothetical protein